ncbi:trans-aconitate 2-methyltransferase [Methylocapsa palsarum]|uniref:Trans-aconitate 2-methyltransferase n=1 Tax=Methylocapsa palsarum TaxID=1612308 RepID=A0A1I4CWM3_9HYPH|nr:trans-aconitate 2-methyltransferase [Methylocapsa palsarum]SFK84291.1 trans-aconitate 2-methyltransferase [Methylocapsa palsarum]
MTDWDADQYLKFELERTRPTIDLLTRLPYEIPRTSVDLGCGPGNSTELLFKRFPKTNITGVDRSPNMLAAAKIRLPQVTFERIDLNHWQPRTSYDLILSSASLQWLPDHGSLFPRLVALLNVGGCLCVQMPDTLQEPIRALMRMVAVEGPWKTKLMPVATSRPRIGSIKDYYGVLATSCNSIDMWHTTYFHPLDNASKIVEWMKGSGLRPFLAPLDQGERHKFLEEYEARIKTAYLPQTNGKVLLPFPTLCIVARRSI